jgi:dUTP pyrophosphatase
MENKTKRFYKVGEMVWVVGQKKEGKVKSINKDTLEVTVTIKEGKTIEEATLKMWEIDKLKYKAKEQLVQKVTRTKKPSLPTVFFAKVRDNAIIPSKRDEDAGYDLYANVEAKEVNGQVIHEIHCPVNKTTLVPTGIAMALPSTHYFNCKHERGSTGKISMSVLAGVVDSGYRGEIFIAITPLHKDVLITSEVTETEVGENVILYPYSKAIAQGTIDLVPQVNIEEISFEDLQNIKSERGATKLGQSGK